MLKASPRKTTSKEQYALIKPNATAYRVKGTNNVKFILNTKQPPYKIQMSSVKDPNE